MTRPDFEDISEVINSVAFAFEMDKEELSKKLSNLFKKRNRNFDRKLFLEKCGIYD